MLLYTTMGLKRSKLASYVSAFAIVSLALFQVLYSPLTMLVASTDSPVSIPVSVPVSEPVSSPVGVTVASNEVALVANQTLSPAKPQVVITDIGASATINVPATVTNPTLNLDNVLTTDGVTKSATLNNAIAINANTSIGQVTMQIPAGVVITGADSNWTGILNAPTILNNSTVNPTGDGGMVATAASVVEIGFGDVPLGLSKAVRILIPGQAGKLVGFSRANVFTRITNSCALDSQAVADSMAVGTECKLDSGSDLVVWTKHFTKFVTFTQTTAAPRASIGSSIGSHDGPFQAPTCSDSKPKSAPVLLSAASSGDNEVTLNWSNAQGPATYYLVGYGTEAGKPVYGNPNAGDKNATSYVVKHLNANTTYYFRVRAGNNCMPGSYSNEIAVKTSGVTIIGPAAGFEEGVLATSKNNEDKIILNPVPGESAISQSFWSRLLSSVTNFFSHLLGK